MDYELGNKEQKLLLKIAREAIETTVCGDQIPTITLNQLPKVLQQDRASFVTLTIDDKLRGCIGC
jgi:AMMECR1 domain-containing protein